MSTNKHPNSADTVTDTKPNYSVFDDCAITILDYLSAIGICLALGFIAIGAYFFFVKVLWF